MTLSTFKPRSFLTSLGLALPLSLAACGDGDDHGHAADAGGVEADAAADEVDANTDIAVNLDFAAVVGAEHFACSEGGEPKTFANLGTANSTVFFKDFRLYVSNVRLIDDGDNEVPVTLTTDGAFQLQTESDGHVALLDFEDGSGNCSDTGNAALNTKIVGTAPAGTYTGVVFEVGVPFALNHLDVATAESPLNISALYWAWAIGHKFARIDYAVDGASPTPWNFHLGSTGCMSDGQTSPPSAECGKPNRATFRIENVALDSDVIVLDAAEIVADSDLTKNASTTPGCMSFPADEPDCTPLFPNLGIDYATGACIGDCSGQTVFTLAE
jgi:uncharacterized repeat protein (TIGR04052 family)